MKICFRIGKIYVNTFCLSRIDLDIQMLLLTNSNIFLDLLNKIENSLVAFSRFFIIISRIFSMNFTKLTQKKYYALYSCLVNWYVYNIEKLWHSIWMLKIKKFKNLIKCRLTSYQNNKDYIRMAILGTFIYVNITFQSSHIFLYL